jgi:AraC family transcriptional regulator, transcriptional activator of pobA
MSSRPASIPLYAEKTREMRPYGFDVISLGSKSRELYDSTVPHRHGFYELFIFSGGGGTHEIDFRSYPVMSNSVHFVSPGQVHHIKPDGLTGHVICFTEDFASIASTDSFTVNFPFFEPGVSAVLDLPHDAIVELHCLTGFLTAAMKQSFAEPGLYRAYLQTILLRLKLVFDNTTVARTTAAPSNPVISKFKKLVGTNYATTTTLAAYAGELKVSVSYLNASCRRHLGQPAGEIIRDRLLLEAKRLLYAGNMQVKEVAYSLGFTDISYFNRFFKKHLGKTPQEFRISGRRELPPGQQ